LKDSHSFVAPSITEVDFISKIWWQCSIVNCITNWFFLAKMMWLVSSKILYGHQHRPYRTQNMLFHLLTIYIKKKILFLVICVENEFQFNIQFIFGSRKTILIDDYITQYWLYICSNKVNVKVTFKVVGGLCSVWYSQPVSLWSLSKKITGVHK
jgi:hypothetical protein